MTKEQLQKRLEELEKENRDLKAQRENMQISYQRSQEQLEELTADLGAKNITLEGLALTLIPFLIKNLKQPDFTELLVDCLKNSTEFLDWVMHI